MLCLSDSQPDSARPKNVLGPIRAALRVARHSVSLKNVPGPIRSSRHSLVLCRLPEKCSWTYRSVHLRPRRVESTRTMFLDPSLRCSPPSPNCVQPEKCSWTYSGDRSARLPQTMHTGIMFADLSGVHSKPLIESCQPEKCSWTYRGVHLRPHQTVPNLKNVLGVIRNCLGPLYAWDIAER